MEHTEHSASYETLSKYLYVCPIVEAVYADGGGTALCCNCMEWIREMRGECVQPMIKCIVSSSCLLLSEWLPGGISPCLPANFKIRLESVWRRIDLFPWRSIAPRGCICMVFDFPSSLFLWIPVSEFQLPLLCPPLRQGLLKT